MLKRTIVSLIMGFGLALPALAQTPAPAAVDKATFVKEAAASNELEIMSSRLALKNSKREEIKGFAREMLADHTKAGKDLVQAAGRGTVTGPKALDQEHQAALQPLIAGGADFDANYVDLQRKAHQDAVQLFTAYAANGDDPKLKALAGKMLATLQKHLSEAEALVR